MNFLTLRLKNTDHNVLFNALYYETSKRFYIFILFAMLFVYITHFLNRLALQYVTIEVH